MTDHLGLIEKILEEDSPVKLMQHSSPHNQSCVLNTITMVIDLGDGTVKDIKIKEQDDPNTLARKFCFENNQDVKIIPILTKSIRKFMATSFNHNASQHNASRISSLKDESSIINRSVLSSATPQVRNRANTSISSVFDRLYKQATDSHRSVKANTSQIDKQNSNPNKQPPLINNGVMIYERNTRLTEENKRKLQKRIQQLKVLQESELTFKPQINPVSNMIVEKMKSIAPEQTIQQRQSRVKREKIIQQRIQKQKQQTNKCTFRPQTNRARSSCSMHSSLHYQSDRFTSLYQDSTKRAKRLKQQAENQNSFVFQPKINKVSEQIVNGVSFQQRLKIYEQQRLAKQEKIQLEKDYKSVVEPATGNLLYRPKTGRPPSTRNQQSLPVGLYLYNHRFEKERAIKRIKEQLNPKAAQANTSSILIFESLKLSSFCSLFALLDENQDGFISSSKINISEVDTKVLQILSPLFNQMEELGAELSEEDFVYSVDRLFQTLPLPDRHLLMRNKKPKSIFEDSSFQPSLNQHSMEIAARQIKVPGVSLYEYCKEKMKGKEQQVRQIRQMLAKQELKQCTFQPKIETGKKRSKTLTKR